MYEFRVVVSPNLESDFKSLVFDLKKIGYIPVIAKDKDSSLGLVISVIKKRNSRHFGLWVNLVLLVATLASTIYVGEGLYAGYFGITKTSWFLYVDGFVYFSLPLLIILGSHEFGHFFMAKRNGVSASLPFFLPAPFTILGTLGAFISLRDPLPDRKTLIKIGAVGPIVGFVMSIVVGVVGAYLGTIQKPVTITTSQVSYLISLPLIYSIFPPLHTLNVHPVAFAAWVGFLVTAINLFPIGQLDGGHVARGLLGKNAKYFSYAFIALLIILGVFYTSWIIFAVIIIVLGLNHPPPLNDISKPTRKEIAVGVIAIALVVLSFSPVPFITHVTPNNATSELSGGNYFILNTNQSYTADHFSLTVSNLNNYTLSLLVSINSPPALNSTPSINTTLTSHQVRDIDLSVWPVNSTVMGHYNFTVKVVASSKTFTYPEGVTVIGVDKNLTANGFNPYSSLSPTINLTIFNYGPPTSLEIFKFNQSSDFAVSNSTGFESTGNNTFLIINADSNISVSVLFNNPLEPGGFVLMNIKNPWYGLVVFYVHQTSQLIGMP